MAQHSDRRLCPIIFWGDRSAQFGIDSQGREVLSAHEHDSGPLHSPIHLGRQAIQIKSNGLGENLFRFECLEFYIAEAAVSEPANSVRGSDKTLRLRDPGERSHENGVDQTEDRCVRSDTEREREHGHGSETRVLQQLAEGESEVVHKAIPKSEGRNSKEVRSPNVERFARRALPSVFGIRISDFIRPSDFGFRTFTRIAAPPLDRLLPRGARAASRPAERRSPTAR